jgi:hypothetical protein
MGAYYPFSLLFLILPLASAYGWYTVSQIWLAGVLMYVYGRILHLHRPAAFIAGLVFQGGAFLVISAAVFPMISGAVVWLPLLLACVEKAIGNWRLEIGDSANLQSPISNRFWWIGLGAIALGFKILAGHIEFTIYTLVVMAAYAAWRLITQLPITHYRTRSSRTATLPKTAASLLAMVLLGAAAGRGAAGAAVRIGPGQLPAGVGHVSRGDGLRLPGAAGGDAGAAQLFWQSHPPQLHRCVQRRRDDP